MAESEHAGVMHHPEAGQSIQLELAHARFACSRGSAVAKWIVLDRRLVAPMGTGPSSRARHEQVRCILHAYLSSQIRLQETRWTMTDFPELRLYTRIG